MIDPVEQAIWDDVEKCENGCWRWHGPEGCNIIRLLAELCGNALPAGVKMFRMPECCMGSVCVNPGHVGTSEQWMRRIRTNTQH